jgi:succinyl-diaminopimelate desuccinylase
VHWEAFQEIDQLLAAQSEFALGTDTVHAVDEYTTVDALVGNAMTCARLPYAYTTLVDDSGG